MRILGLMVMGLALIAAQSALSQSKIDSGNAYLPGCRAVLDENNYQDLLSQGRCTGVVSAMIGIGEYLAPAFRNFIPDGVTTGQGIRVVLSYLDANPTQLHNDFRFLVASALKAAWPCK
jgi:hypothetical protein